MSGVDLRNNTVSQSLLMEDGEVNNPGDPLQQDSQME